MSFNERVNELPLILRLPFIVVSLGLFVIMFIPYVVMVTVARILNLQE